VILKTWTEICSLELPYFDREIPGNLVESFTQSAVLVLIRPGLSVNESEVLLTKRSQEVKHHKGEIAFPGGMRDPKDLDLKTTALREMQEEVGIAPTDVALVSSLPPLVTLSSRFSITPFVAVAKMTTLKPTSDSPEIDSYFWVKLSQFGLPGVYSQEDFRSGAATFKTHVYSINGERVWGATAFVLKNILDRIDAINENGIKKSP